MDHTIPLTFTIPSPSVVFIHLQWCCCCFHLHYHCWLYKFQRWHTQNIQVSNMSLWPSFHPPRYPFTRTDPERTLFLFCAVSAYALLSTEPNRVPNHQSSIDRHPLNILLARGISMSGCAFLGTRYPCHPLNWHPKHTRNGPNPPTTPNVTPPNHELVCSICDWFYPGTQLQCEPVRQSVPFAWGWWFEAKEKYSGGGKNRIWLIYFISI